MDAKIERMQREVEEIVKVHPEMRKGLEELQAEREERAFEMKYRSGGFMVKVKRDGGEFTIEWSRTYLVEYTVGGALYQVGFRRDESVGLVHLIPRSPGDRTITINGLAEGTNYLMLLSFDRDDRTPINAMGIQLSVPLSPEKWKLLKNATELHEDRSKALKKDVQEYLRNSAAFDNPLKKVLRKSKAGTSAPMRKMFESMTLKIG
jgi:hypothetical protein